MVDVSRFIRTSPVRIFCKRMKRKDSRFVMSPLGPYVKGCGRWVDCSFYYVYGVFRWRNPQMSLWMSLDRGKPSSGSLLLLTLLRPGFPPLRNLPSINPLTLRLLSILCRVNRFPDKTSYPRSLFRTLRGFRTLLFSSLLNPGWPLPPPIKWKTPWTTLLICYFVCLFDKL